MREQGARCDLTYRVHSDMLHVKSESGALDSVGAEDGMRSCETHAAVLYTDLLSVSTAEGTIAAESELC